MYVRVRVCVCVCVWMCGCVDEGQAWEAHSHALVLPPCSLMLSAFSSASLPLSFPLPSFHTHTHTQAAFLARCNGARVDMVRFGEFTEQQFREQVVSVCSSGEEHLVVSYSRRALQQTGDGHFSPVGGYHRERDLVLILDVVRREGVGEEEEEEEEEEEGRRGCGGEEDALLSCTLSTSI